MQRMILFASILAAASLAPLACGDDAPPAPTCTVGPGSCPNICEGGAEVEGALCNAPGQCACGLACDTRDGVPGVCSSGWELGLSDYGTVDAPCSCEATDPIDPVVLKAAGEQCSQTAECEAGLECLNFLCATPAGGGGLGADCTSDVDCGEGLNCVNFICTEAPPPDINDCDKGAPAGAECNPYCQIGCEPDEQCSYFATVSCGGFGETGLSEPCSGSQFCEVGFACVGLTSQPDLGSVCRQFCVEDVDCPGDRLCSVSINLANGTQQVTMCSEAFTPCEPFADPSNCKADEGCYYSSQTKASECLAGGALQEGVVCYGEPPGTCAAGLQCLVTCTPLCGAGVDGGEAVDGNCICSTGTNGPPCTATCGSQSADTIDEATGMAQCLTATPPATCDIFAQDCPAGDKCTKVTGGIACTSDGTEQPGDICGGSNGGCVAGSLCINSQCAEVCDATEGATGPSSCAEKCGSSGNLSPAIWNIGFCQDAEPSEPCDFWLQDCADPAKSCYVASTGATCLAPTNTAQDGENCQYLTDCDQGLYCASNTCIVPCSLDASSTEYCDSVCPANYTAVSTNTGIGKCD